MSHPKKTNLSNLDLRQEISGEASRKRGVKQLAKIKSKGNDKKSVKLSDYFILPIKNIDFTIEVDAELNRNQIIDRFKNYQVTTDLKTKI